MKPFSRKCFLNTLRFKKEYIRLLHGEYVVILLELVGFTTILPRTERVMEYHTKHR